MHSVWHVSTLWSYTYWIHWIVASAADVGLLGRDVISNVHTYTEAVGETPTVYHGAFVSFSYNSI